MSAACVGTFVPFHDSPRNGRRSANVGWIVTESGCHIWQGASFRGGYGQVWCDGRAQAVHRVRYEREVGPVPEGMELDHFVCDNPPCCNPEHVRPASPRENTLRANSLQSANAGKTHCLNGHPLTGDNLRSWDAAHGERKCLACARVRDRQRRADKRATTTGGRDAD